MNWLRRARPTAPGIAECLAGLAVLQAARQAALDMGLTVLLTMLAVASVYVAGVRREWHNKTRQIDGAEALFRRLQASFIGVVHKSSDGRILDANDSFLRVIGYTPEDLRRGLRWDKITPPERLTQDRRLAEERAAAGSCEPWEKEYIRKDGSRVPVLIGVASSGKPLTSYACFVVDMTARKQAEKALSELSGQLLRLRDEERRQIARELHDTTAQNLSAVAMNLSLLQNTYCESRIEHAVMDSLSLVEQCLREVRTLSYLLHPPLLDELGLHVALRSYLEGFSRRSGIQVELNVAADVGRYPAEVEMTLFRIVQESLTNVHRHSGSRTAAVEIAQQGGGVWLRVIDHGCGMANAMAPSAANGVEYMGVGLAGIRERAAQLGGTVTIETGGHGTTLQVSLPAPMEA